MQYNLDTAQAVGGGGGGERETNNNVSDSTDIDNNASLQEALKAYESDLNVPASNFNLQHFGYKNFGILNLTIGHLNRTNYTGLTVSVSAGVLNIHSLIITDYAYTHRVTFILIFLMDCGQLIGALSINTNRQILLRAHCVHPRPHHHVS